MQFKNSLLYLGAYKIITTTTMPQEERLEKEEETKRLILTELASTFSDDREFLTKVNKITFGLISK